jgi:DNA-binding NarL/FixJ family response regulator
LLEALDRLVDGAASPDAHAHRALAQAELSRVEGRPAPERWRAASAAFDALGEPFPAAVARLHEAETALIAGGERATAADALAAARAAATRLGAVPLLDAVEALARRARLKLAGEAPPAAVEADETGLTAREAEVLELLAEGLTNREIAARLFISVKTVGAHMAHIYDKLGVHSRVEAASRARRLE